MGDSPLFTVPLEIRQLIYKYYLSFEKGDKRWHKSQWEAYLDYSKPLSTPLPGPDGHLQAHIHRITIGCTKYRCVAVHWPGEFWPGLHIAVHGTLRFERLRHLVLSVNDEDLFAPGWSEFFEAIASKMCALEHLTMDWEFFSEAEDYNENRKRRLLQPLHSITSLRTIRINGFPRESWRQAIEQEMKGTNVVIKFIRNRWWIWWP